MTRNVAKVSSVFGSDSDSYCSDSFIVFYSFCNNHGVHRKTTTGYRQDYKMAVGEISVNSEPSECLTGGRTRLRENEI